MKVEITHDSLCGYTVLVDGEVCLECLSEDDLNELTLGEIKRLMETEN